MIKIENIDLAYDQTLIKDGRLLLNEGQILCLAEIAAVVKHITILSWLN